MTNARSDVQKITGSNLLISMTELLRIQLAFCLSTALKVLTCVIDNYLDLFAHSRLFSIRLFS